MAITVNIYYSGVDGNARKFVEEMIESGTVDKIRQQKGNISYEYFFAYSDENTVLLVDKWLSQEDIDKHHKSQMMQTINDLRNKYKLRLRIEKFED